MTREGDCQVNGGGSRGAGSGNMEEVKQIWISKVVDDL